MASKGDINKTEIQPDLPERWVTIPFKEGLVKTGSFAKLKSKEYSDEGVYPVIDQGEKFISGFVNEQELIYKGDLPVVIFGDHTRIVKYIDFEFAAGADGTKILKCFKALDERFFFYYLKVLVIPSFGYSRHFKVFESLDLPIPPLPEQKRIVAKLDALFGHLDAVKTKLDRIPELLKNFRQQVLTQAVTGKLTEGWREETLPFNWTKMKIGEFMTEVKVKINPDEINEVKYVGLEHIESGKGLVAVGTSLSVNSSKTQFQSGDVLYGKLRPYLNKHFVSDFDGICSTDILVYRNKNLSSAKFFDYYLGTTDLIKKANAESKGINLPRVSSKILNSFHIDVPPLIEQDEIVNRVDELFSIAYSIESKYNSLKVKIDHLPQAILNKAFKGELVAQDAGDEPASELLKRIQKAKGGKR